MLPMLLRTVVLFAGLALVLAACGDGDGDGGSPSDVTPGAQATSDSPEAIALATALAGVDLSTTPTPGPPRAADVAALEDLAARFEVSVDEIEVVSVEAMEWPDGCLGVGQPDEVCTQAIVPGFEVLLRFGETVVTYRTNETGTLVRFATVSIGD